MFSGIDEIDWASMSHAYGDASDVPVILRGLASADQEEREAALDAMYGAVHHQGDVHDSTVACVPFLYDLVGTPGLADRGAIVQLLCSIDGDGRDLGELDVWTDDEDEYAAWLDNYARVETEIRRRSPLLLDLADEDPELRAQLPMAWVRLHEDTTRVRDLLLARLAVEREATVLRALATALGELAFRRSRFTAEAAVALRGLVADDSGDPGLRLCALVQLARCAPGDLPEDAVATAAEVMRVAREAGDAAPGPTAEPSAPPTTMIAYLRALRARHHPSPVSPWATDLMGDLHRALGDRVRERFALLEDQLRSPDWGQRREAIDMAGALLSGWRGPHEESVRLLGEQLYEPEHRLVKWAAGELEWLQAIGGPAAGALAERVAAGPRFPLQRDWEDTTYGACLSALAAQGDGRAVPGLVDVLAYGKVPEHLGAWLGRMAPESAAPLAPVLHDRLARTDPWRAPYRTERLLEALSVLGSPECLPLALRILRDRDGRGVRLQDAALKALARLGPAACAEALAAMPDVRRTAGDPSATYRLYAAAVIAEAEGATRAVLAALTDALTGDRGFARHLAFTIVDRLGPAAAPLLPTLRTLVAQEASEPAGELATALWRAGGDHEESLRALLASWRATRRNRPSVARALHAMGLGAAEAISLVREEVSHPRRYGNEDSIPDRSRRRYDCTTDELLLHHCTETLALHS
ncbi:hypothetical protein ACFPM3_06135 [Streptomyces coeruleoprunus]|uniref:HEAT repeat domain-containing protein n=1 Tax=Streptomyces coeruleoprunus TaxID=285563 RepID=A0ABV9X9L3_9ACTN